MSATHLDVAGTRFRVAADRPELAALVRQIYAWPGWRVLRGCERCKSICTDVRPCGCCEIYGTKTGGGTIFYPEDGKRHVDLMLVDEFLQRAERKLSADAA